MDTIKKLIPGAAVRRARRLQGQVQAAFGAPHWCPVCKSRVHRFRQLSAFYNDNLKKYGWPFEVHEAETCNQDGYSCPMCEATDRDRLYALYLDKYFSDLPEDRAISIVDFAPSASLAAFIRGHIASSGKNMSYRTADAFAEGVDDRADITDLLIYDDEQFDFFLCSHVLEHVSDDRKALRELYRILKPGSKGILMVPIILSITEIDEDPTVVDEAERWRRFGQFDHVRVYSKSGFIQRVIEAGFRIVEYGKEFFGDESFVRHGISSQSILYVVEK